ncbi:MAG: MEDS domain-containing protein [Acidiferrobacteraceae bacterium]
MSYPFSQATDVAAPPAACTGDHAAQFYEGDELLGTRVAGFILEGLQTDAAVIVIATRSHRRLFETHLRAQGVDVAGARARRQLMMMDAEATLARLMVNGRLDRTRFARLAVDLIEKAHGRHAEVRAYGEMVALLWERGDVEATLALEEAWNELGKTHRFSLLCGYPMHHFGEPKNDEAFQKICAAHSHVAPATDFVLPQGDDVHYQQHTIAVLKQHARSLEREIGQHRKTVKALQETLDTLAASRARLDAVLRQMPAGVLIVDAREGQVVLANGQIEALFSHPFSGSWEEVRTRMAGFHADGTAYAPHEWPLARSLAHGEVVTEEEIDYVRPDGRRGALSVSSGPIRDARGGIVAAVGMFTDVTLRKELEVERVNTGKLESVGLLAAGIAHDFNNILTAVLGNVMLAKLLSGDGSAADVLLQAEQGALRGRGLTQQLLTFSRGGAPVRKPCAVGEFLQQTAAFVLRGSPCRLAWQLAEPLWPVSMDLGQMTQVLTNLLVNAMEAMPQGGTVTVAARNRRLEAINPYALLMGNYVEFSVGDSGGGIAPHLLEHLFEPYLTTKKKGTGLGLATSYSIVKRHGGHIGVLSTREGALFTVLLPASPDAALPAVERPPEPVSGQGRVLLMDDDPSVREVGAALLRQLGYHVSVASDGREAVADYAQAMTTQPFDVVILDLTIPGGMGGLECMVRLRAIDPAVTAIVSSGYANDPVMANFREYGFDAVIAKPYPLTDLSQAVQEAMQRSRHAAAIQPPLA